MCMQLDRLRFRLRCISGISMLGKPKPAYKIERCEGLVLSIACNIYQARYFKPIEYSHIVKQVNG